MTKLDDNEVVKATLKLSESYKNWIENQIKDAPSCITNADFRWAFLLQSIARLDINIKYLYNRLEGTKGD